MHYTAATSLNIVRNITTFCGFCEGLHTANYSVVGRLEDQIDFPLPTCISDSMLSRVVLEHDFTNSRSTARLIMSEKSLEASEPVANSRVTETEDSQHDRVRTIQQDSSSGGGEERQSVKTKSRPACKIKKQ